MVESAAVIYAAQQESIKPVVVLWCSACHGYGHDPFDGSMCEDCDGLGGFDEETQLPVRWIAPDVARRGLKASLVSYDEAQQLDEIEVPD